MKRAILILFAVIGAGVTALFVLAVALSWAFMGETTLPDRVVLEVDLSRGLVETTPDDPILLALEDPTLKTRDFVLALARAKSDPRVAGVLVRGDGGLPGWATAEELRDAILDFRESGKPALYFTESFGELSPGQLPYYLATAFDDIYIQPSGEVGLAPLLMETLFFRGLLDRWEIVPRFDRRREYKDAAEIFTEREFTPDSREARQAVLADLEGELVGAIVAGRGLSEEEAREVLQGGPYPAREAMETGLVDGLVYLDEVYDEMQELVGEEPEYLSIEEYRAGSGRGGGGGQRVALVYGVGAIYRGEGGFDFLTGEGAMGSATVARAIRAAAGDSSVRAILFRIDSPGGSWPASDQVRREIRRARDRGIPVVVSMGNLAASGGYVIAMDADRIVAHPSTITGSIGVVGGRLVLDDFLSSLGIDVGTITVEEGENFYASMEDYSPRDWERFQLFLDRIYEDFVQGVAEGRGMTVAEVEPIARGRIWSGRDALELGLVDRLGGFAVALDEVRNLIDVEADAPLSLVVYPAERSLLELLLERARVDGGAGVFAGRSVGAAASTLREMLRSGARLGVLSAPGPVRSPSWEVPGR